jgi:hypothetical protein
MAQHGICGISGAGLSVWEGALFDFVTMFISWVVFFRAFVNFQKRRFLSVWTILACILITIIAVYSDALYSDCCDDGWRSVENLLDSERDNYEKQRDTH